MSKPRKLLHEFFGKYEVVEVEVPYIRIDHKFKIFMDGNPKSEVFEVKIAYNIAFITVENQENLPNGCDYSFLIELADAYLNHKYEYRIFIKSEYCNAEAMPYLTSKPHLQDRVYLELTIGRGDFQKFARSNEIVTSSEMREKLLVKTYSDYSDAYLLFAPGNRLVHAKLNLFAPAGETIFQEPGYSWTGMQYDISKHHVDTRLYKNMSMLEKIASDYLGYSFIGWMFREL